jgi:hypothetical protein
MIAVVIMNGMINKCKWKKLVEIIEDLDVRSLRCY